MEKEKEKDPLPAPKKDNAPKKDEEPKKDAPKKPPNKADKVTTVNDIVEEEVDYKRTYKLDNPADRRIEYFIPTTMCLVMKSVDNLEKMQVRLVFTLIVRCNLDGFDAETQDWIKENLKLRLNEEEHDIGTNRKLSDGKLTITHRGQSTIFFDPQFHDLPFDQQDIPLKLEMTSILNPAPKPPHNYRFNVLYYPDITPTLLSWKSDADRLPEFNINVKGTTASMGIERKDVDGKPLYIYSPYMTFHINLYREPEHLIISTSLPLMLLNLATLTIFAPGTAYGDKLGVLVTLLLAMFAFIPTLREQIPQVPYTTLLERQIYVCIAALFLAFLEAVITQLLSPEITANDSYPIQSYVLLALSIATIVVSNLYFLIRYLFHKTKIRTYLTPSEEAELKIQSSRFDWGKANDWKSILDLPQDNTLGKPKDPTVSKWERADDGKSKIVPGSVH